ncbi:hypothetical protein K458DRAFT_407290 [Lentithecium fluviatile CBS 122367]|uniref:Secreted protein n=1 Tax=Lentithecium fluviatile CBS 122367 TaxID=1168545 RepID=A0A6G1IRE8_9PLEO|nr:hypothetical protein K458DRAFT_407290 [Lentithecium fluviatile CBS 122367]
MFKPPLSFLLMLMSLHIFPSLIHTRPKNITSQHTPYIMAAVTIQTPASTIVIAEQTPFIPGLSISPAFGKMKAHQLSEKCIYRAQKQKARRQRKMPAGIPAAFQMSPVGVDVMPRKFARRTLDA